MRSDGLRRILTGKEWVEGQASGRIALLGGGARHLHPGMAVRIGRCTYRVSRILGADEVLVDRPLWWLALRWLKTTWAVVRG
jgi:hypothetical protein